MATAKWKDEMKKFSDRNLYMSHLEPWTTNETLLNICQQYGPILSVKVILESDEMKVCKGYGFVDYEFPRDAKVALTGLTNDGYHVRWAWHQKQDETNVYINGLPDWVSEEEIKMLLSPFGTVISSQVPRNTQTQKSKGYALARLTTKEACEKIIEEFNGENCQDIQGLTVRCKAKFANVTLRHKRSPGNKTSNKVGGLPPMPERNCQVPQLCYPVPLLHNGCSAMVPSQMRFPPPTLLPPMWCPPPTPQQMQTTFVFVGPYPMGGAICPVNFNSGLPCQYQSTIQPTVPHCYGPASVPQIQYAQLPQTSQPTYIPSQQVYIQPFNLNGR